MFNPADFGIIGNEVSPENLVKARAEYEKYVAAHKGNDAKPEAPKLENPADQELADNVTVAIRRWMFGMIDDNPILSLILPDVLAAVSKDVKTFRDWYVADCTRKGATVSVDTDTVKKTAEQFAAMINGLFTGARFMTIQNENGETVPVASLLPADFIKRDKDGNPILNSDGNPVPNLSRGPKAKDAAKAGGKKVGGYFLRYRFYPGATLDNPLWFINADMQEIPAGTFSDEIGLRYVSTPTYRVERTDVFSSLPHTEKVTPTGRISRHLNMPKDGSSVFVQFETGVIESWLPTDSTVTEEELSDDDDDDSETETE